MVRKLRNLVLGSLGVLVCEPAPARAASLVTKDMELMLVFATPKKLVGASPVVVPVQQPESSDKCFAYRSAKAAVGRSFREKVPYYVCNRQLDPLSALWKARPCRKELLPAEKTVLGVLVRNSANVSVCKMGRDPKGEHTVIDGSPWLPNLTLRHIPDCDVIFRSSCK